ncbi:MAG: ArsR/SmtB family transcription factor [Bacillota bacterium]|jgi:ArsR family transcriptional regulator
MKRDCSKDAQIFKVLGDENRLYILTLLRNGEKCACELLEALDFTQSTLSHHMKLLCGAGLVRGRKAGKWVYYSLDDEGGAYVNRALKRYTNIRLRKELL